MFLELFGAFVARRVGTRGTPPRPRRLKPALEVLEDRVVPAFTPAGTFSTGTALSGVALGDLNKDGKLDMVVANPNANTIAVFLSDGSGTFGGSPATYATGTTPADVILADLNGDGYLDLATANQGGNSVSVFLNDTQPNPGFGRTDYNNVGPQPQRLAVGDFNNDGRPDLVLTAGGSNYAAELKNTGNGTFAYYNSFLVGQFPVGVVVADFNGDGNLDFAATSSQANVVAICTGKGDGTFDPARTRSTDGQRPRGFAVGDFNGDGRPDLAVTLFDTNSVDVLFGDNQLAFSKRAVTFLEQPNSNPDDLAVADFNGDGRPDLAVLNRGTGKVSVLLDTTQGQLTTSRDYDVGTGSRAVAAGDLNGDGRPDLVAVNEASMDGTILLNQGDPPTSAPPPAPATPTPGSQLPGPFLFSPGKPRLNPRTHRYRQVLTVRYTGIQDLQGPLTLALEQLNAKVTLRKAAGAAMGKTAGGAPTVVVTPAGGRLSPGQLLAVVLEFSASSSKRIRYIPRVFAG
jgi:hypothetical protein